MGSYEILTRLEQSGELKQLVKDGHCYPCVFRNLEIARYVDMRMKTGSKKMQAVSDVEEDFGMCEKTVYNILRTFK